MKTIEFNPEKRKKLIEERGIDLVEIVYIIESGNYLEILEHPTRDHQKLFIINLNGYICCVPFVEDDEKIFLKTARYDRRYHKQFTS